MTVANTQKDSFQYVGSMLETSNKTPHSWSYLLISEK